MLKLYTKFKANESGATAIEYGLIAALVAVGLIAALTLLGGSLEGAFNGAANALTGATSDLDTTAPAD